MCVLERICEPQCKSIVTTAALSMIQTASRLRFCFFNHSYGQVLLENPEFFYLTGADKSDRLNQTRVVSWKVFYGSIILNQAFLARVEASSAFSPGYSAGTMADIS